METKLSKQTKKFGKILPKIEKEISDILAALMEKTYASKTYKLHNVPVGGIYYLAADAKAISRFDHQSGRGCWRYLFDLKTREYVGIAKETDSGSYKMLR